MGIWRSVSEASPRARAPADLRANASAAAAAVLFGASVVAVRVAVYVNLNPVVAALLGVVLLGERRSGLFLLGFAAVVAGVLLVNWPGRRT
jgi:drug/metabolite transporter (DMT)-like permease